MMLYKETVEALGIDPAKLPEETPLSKRDRSKAWKLTNKVWAEICGEEPNDGSNGSSGDSAAAECVDVATDGSGGSDGSGDTREQ